MNVIRYQRERTHGRNVIISSKSELRILQVLVKRRLEELGLGLTEDRVASLAKRLIEEASAVSGDIVLRAAKRGVFAGELIGIVMSRALVAEELGALPTAWFFLDDYARWLGQKEQGIADLLALGVAEEGGQRVLRAVVTEAKYVSAGSLAEERRTSRRQLLDTVRRVNDALFGDPGRLDRDLWLSRLSDLLLDAVRGVGDAHLFDDLRSQVRAGSARIDLRGYSHVFVWGPADSGSMDDQEEVPDVPHGLQEVFGRGALRDLLIAYEARSPLQSIRRRLGDLRSWESVSYLLPSSRVQWIAQPSGDGGPDGGNGGGGPGRPGGGRGRASERPVKGDSPRNRESRGEADGEQGRAPVHASVPLVGETAVGTGSSVEWGQGLAQLIASRSASTTEAPEMGPWLDEVTASLRAALLGYGLQAKVTGSRLTPNAALVRLRGSDRLGLEDLESRQSALLTTHGLRVISVAAQPGEIVVAIERPSRAVVPLWDVWRRRAINRGSSGLNLSFAVGVRELDGNLMYLNLGGPFGDMQQHEPHTLIAGATGSGKSVLLQNLLLDIAATNPSRLAHIHLIDPKMGVDYASVEGLPHLRGGIVTKQEEALEVLSSMVVEMDRRYETFRGKGRDLQSFNAKVSPAERLPALFVVHDEFADWMMVEEYRDHVTSQVGRLGAKARGAGIHLVFAAQRPEASVMPMQLRSNLGNRLVLRVADVGTSEIALGMKGAERLLAKGHLAAKLAGEPGLIFAQVPYMGDDDMLSAVQAIRSSDVA